MKTFQEFLEESALARLALRGIRAASKGAKVARTADGGRRVTSAARRSRTATPRAAMTRAEKGDTFKSVGDRQIKKAQVDPNSKFFDPVKQKEYKRQVSYWGNKDRTVLSGAAPRDRNITIARSAAQKAGFSGGGNKNRVDFNTRNKDYTTYPSDKYPDDMKHPKSNTQVDTQIETLPSGRVAAAKASGTKQPEPVKRPKASLGTFGRTTRRVPSTDEIARNMKEYLRRVKKTGGNERQPVHKVDFIQRSDATLYKDALDKYARKRGRNFIQQQKDLPKNLEKAGAKKGDIISGQPSPMMSGENPQQGIKQREKMYAKRFGRRVQPLDPTGRVRGMIGAVGGEVKEQASPYQPFKAPKPIIPSPPPPGFREKYIDPLKKKTQTQTESAQRKEYEETRHEDDTYQTVQQKLQNPRLRKLRRFFNREQGRYTV